MLAIVDYGVGNLGSIRNMFKKIGVPAEIVTEPDQLAGADKIVLPGVGAFDAGMRSLERSGMRPALVEYVHSRGVPILGICLGMQLMTRSSEEGVSPGLGWIDADAMLIRPENPDLKVPHMGWNLVRATKSDPLIDTLPEEARFYFVHSYQVRCNDLRDVLLETTYGEGFHSAFRSGNIWGVQFHPEKSHKFGMALLRNFAERC
ncbi:MAG: imidazole glycerol phosphate synthase subunit HisH [Dechloromonas sp.]|uniref:Imidazole glycerol phosphate synthase subunit HisH n=1 Tax=Candidatus Dechloromonas phosphorivorans TaxID=2899244 RepID=A0A9D7LUR9_9RHOO|nr:imidazole glycerol phosphate synthase subunit HisH [Candidatus Dechloromonas phosphorivorans]